VPETGLSIVPGIMLTSARPDVMRGEETQVIGALGEADGGCVVLPGTHCKWVDVEAGRITRFRTFMTGEVFAALRDHTILGAFSGGDEADEGAFDRAVLTARESTDGLAALLFSARAMVLAGHLPAEGARDYLSGLLIGDELRAAPARAEPLLIGEPALCARYQRAMRLCGMTARIAPPDAAAAGLWRIARVAGLIAAEGRAQDVS
jgi:2-dehydro-3-deoxygalactonokinase